MSHVLFAKGAEAELKTGGEDIPDGHINIWWTFLKYVCPVVIFVVLLNVFGVFGEFVGG